MTKEEVLEAFEEFEKDLSRSDSLYRGLSFGHRFVGSDQTIKDLVNNPYKYLKDQEVYISLLAKLVIKLDIKDIVKDWGLTSLDNLKGYSYKGVWFLTK